VSAVRPVQASLLPDHAPDRNIGPVPPSVQTGSNAALIARLAPIYLQGEVLDCTYGRGSWWTRWRPPDLVAHDIDLDGVDFTNLPHPDNSFDTVCFDPPYVPAGGKRGAFVRPGEQDFRDRFGLKPFSRADIVTLFRGGMAECARVVRPKGFVLTKCADYVSGGQFFLGHIDMVDAANEFGLRAWDLVVHHTGSGPGGHNITTIQRARRHHSYLIVFRPQKHEDHTTHTT
jgi:SAM-dependent methyltransferase